MLVRFGGLSSEAVLPHMPGTDHPTMTTDPAGTIHESKNLHFYGVAASTADRELFAADELR